MDFHFLLPDGTRLTDLRTENTDAGEVVFHSPAFIPKYESNSKRYKSQYCSYLPESDCAENSFCQLAISSTVSSTKRLFF
jgi:hypothetical protein